MNHATTPARRAAPGLLVDPESDDDPRRPGRRGVRGGQTIDAIAPVITGRFGASAPADLELAYVYSSGPPRTRSTCSGNVAGHATRGGRRPSSGIELDAALASERLLIDVRTASEFAKGSIEGALNIPVDELRDRPDEVPAGPVVVHRAVGSRGHRRRPDPAPARVGVTQPQRRLTRPGAPARAEPAGGLSAARPVP